MSLRSVLSIVRYTLCNVQSCDNHVTVHPLEIVAFLTYLTKQTSLMLLRPFSKPLSGFVWWISSCALGGYPVLVPVKTDFGQIASHYL